MADVGEGLGANVEDSVLRSFEPESEVLAPPPDEVQDGSAAAQGDAAQGYAPQEAVVSDPAPPATPAADDDGTSSSSGSDNEEEKRAESVPPQASDEAAAGAGAAPGAGKWIDKLHPAVKKHAETVMNHPYVAATAGTLRQRAGAAQERIQPMVQKGTSAIRAGGTRTLETGKKVYNREEGYEPKRFVPFFAAIVGLLALGLLIRDLANRYYPGVLNMQMKSEL